MTAPFGEETVLHALLERRFAEAKRYAVDMMRTAQFENAQEKILASARPRSFLGIRLSHRLHWLLEMPVIEVTAPQTDSIRYGIAASGELVVKHPVTHDVNGHAVIVRTLTGVTELLDTWQIVHPDEVEPGAHEYVIRLLERTVYPAA